MKSNLTDFKTGWFSLALELSTSEIDQLIGALEALKGGSDHFHFRSDFTGGPGLGDIEVSCCGHTQHMDLVLDVTPPVYPEDGTPNKPM
ncbi:MAG: hypothetical protein VYE77_11785 [Planctomycetota bacterium]|nr:hypothetical protein [Planctomycetota bacterium]